LNAASVYTPLTLTFSATSLTFPVLQIGLTSAPQTVTVSNVSSHTATFTSITTGGDFIQTNTCPATLNAGQNCTVTVSFKPTTSGTRKGSLTVKDNCPGSPTPDRHAYGRRRHQSDDTLAEHPQLSRSDAPGTSSTMSITLYNDGTAAVTSRASAFLQRIALSPKPTTVRRL
jgi:hypothetical protein